jgi:hypothetical protein
MVVPANGKAPKLRHAGRATVAGEPAGAAIATLAASGFVGQSVPLLIELMLKGDPRSGGGIKRSRTGNKKAN